MEERKTNTTESIILVIIGISLPVILLCALCNNLGKNEEYKQIRQQICKQVYTSTNDYINCSHRPIEETIELLKPIK